MNTQDLANAKDPDLRASLAALQRAALLARKIAMQTDTGIVIVQDNELRYITAEELRQEALEDYDLATDVLERVHKEQEPVHSAADVRADLGLND